MTCIFLTNEAVTEYNRETLKKSGKVYYLIHAEHSGLASSGGESEKYGGLKTLLEVGLSQRVMLRNNFCVMASLANGSLGVVEQFIKLSNDDGNPKESRGPINFHDPDVILVRVIPLG